MRYVSLFTGIGGFDLALDRAGYVGLAMVERDRACQSVLRKRFPNVPLHDDVMTFGRKDVHGTVDIVAGGSPCQAFSVAGLRQSLRDHRGNLAFEFIRICNELQPRYVIWENVSGVLSTRDNAFGCFLAGLVGEDTALVPARGKWTNAGVVAGPQRIAAWRVLDAQYFGVAQRRRRVFVVASATGAERSCIEILFEREGVRWDTPPSREAREGVASFAPSSIGGYTEGLGTLRANGGDNGGGSEQIIVGSLRSNAYNNSDPTMEAQQLVVQQNAISDPNVANGVDTKVRHDYDNQVGTAIVAFNIQHNDGGSHKRKDRPNGGIYVQETDISLTVGTTDLTAVTQNTIVRRLTPTECERLQAFPDGWTEGQADTPRYKQLGNAVCVNVVEWIARRI